MTDDAKAPTLTDQQRDAIEANSPLYLSACPGAGKTHVLAERHLATPQGQRRRGRALISFTNRAAEEIRRRCDRPELLEFPHFVGTLDVFLQQFLVRPFLPEGPPTWQRLISWGDLGTNDSYKVLGRVPLTDFVFDYDIATMRVTARLPGAAKLLMNAVHPEERFLAAAQAMREKLWRTGHYMTGLELRIMALENAADPTVTAVLRERFAEIVIDEAQDCTELDIAILARLHAGEIPLFVVADPNQAIYEHQGATPEVLAKLTETIEQHLELTGNRRCSQNICDLAATMRPKDTATPDVACGRWREDTTPLLLIPFANQSKDKKRIGVHSRHEAAEVFARASGSLDPACADVLFLAWAQDSVPRPGKIGQAALPNTAPAWKLASAAWTYQHAETDQQQLLDAMNIARAVLVRYWYPGEPGDVDRILTAHGISTSISRRYAASLLASLPDVDTRPAGDWVSDARKRIIDHPAPADAVPLEPAKYRLTVGTRDYDRAATIAQAAGLGAAHRADGSDDTAPMTSTTIHKAKGGEADAVLIALSDPKDVRELLTEWTGKDTDTSKVLRVYYVALTRGRRLIGLTYPYTCHIELTTHLAALGIGYRVATECEPGSGKKREQSHVPANDYGMDAIPGLM